MKDKKILKEYSRNYLKLLEYGDAFGDVIAEPEDLANIFIRPFSDLSKTTKRTIQGLGSQSRASLNVLYQEIKTTLIPGLTADYSQVFKDERRRREQIKKKFPEVFERTEKALGAEAKTIAFMLNPSLAIGGLMTKKTPETALELVKLFAGEDEFVKQKVDQASGMIDKIKKAGEKLITKKIIPTELEKIVGGRGEGFGENVKRNFYTKLLKEANQQEEIANVVQSVLNDPRVQRAIKNSTIARRIRTETEGAINQSIREIEEEARNLLNVQNLERLEQLLGKKFDLGNVSDVQPNELQTIKSIGLQQIKKGVLGFYNNLINKNLQEFEGMGISERNRLVQKYEDLKNRLESYLRQAER